MYFFKMPRAFRSKYWCFTSFEKDENDTLIIPHFSEEDDTSEGRMTYMICGYEICPKSKKQHLQCYVEFKDKITLMTAKKRLKLNKAHLEARKGSGIEASDYCKKEGNFFIRPENGEPSPDQQGQRTDYATFKTAVLAGEFNTWEDILFDDRFDHIVASKRNWANEIFTAWQRRQVPLQRQIEVYVYWGDTGTGKTHKVLTENEDCFQYNPNIMRGSWTGYNGQSTVLIDEFYGQVKASEMLKYLQGWRQQVHVNYSYTFLQYNKIFITSNKHPEDWYHSWENIPVEVKEAFFDRITDIVHFTGASKRAKTIPNPNTPTATLRSESD